MVFKVDNLLARVHQPVVSTSVKKYRFAIGAPFKKVLAKRVEQWNQWMITLVSDVRKTKF